MSASLSLYVRPMKMYVKLANSLASWNNMRKTGRLLLTRAQPLHRKGAARCKKIERKLQTTDRENDSFVDADGFIFLRSNQSSTIPLTWPAQDLPKVNSKTNMSDFAVRMHSDFIYCSPHCTKMVFFFPFPAYVLAWSSVAFKVSEVSVKWVLSLFLIFSHRSSNQKRKLWEKRLISSCAWTVFHFCVVYISFACGFHCARSTSRSIHSVWGRRNNFGGTTGHSLSSISKERCVLTCIQVETNGQTWYIQYFFAIQRHACVR